MWTRISGKNQNRRKTPARQIPCGCLKIRVILLAQILTNQNLQQFIAVNLANQRAGVVFGSYDGTSRDGMNIEIYTNGRVRLYYKVAGVAYSYVFSADVRSEWLTHIAVVIDGLSVTLYVNGTKSETVSLTVAVPTITDGFSVGSDKRTSDGQYFKGAIYGISLFEDARMAEDIAMDAVIVSENADGLLYSEYYVEKK